LQADDEKKNEGCSSKQQQKKGDGGLQSNVFHGERRQWAPDVRRIKEGGPSGERVLINKITLTPRMFAGELGVSVKNPVQEM